MTTIELAFVAPLVLYVLAWDSLATQFTYLALTTALVSQIPKRYQHPLTLLPKCPRHAHTTWHVVVWCRWCEWWVGGAQICVALPSLSRWPCANGELSPSRCSL